MNLSQPSNRRRFLTRSASQRIDRGMWHLRSYQVLGPFERVVSGGGRTFHCAIRMSIFCTILGNQFIRCSTARKRKRTEKQQKNNNNNKMNFAQDSTASSEITAVTTPDHIIDQQVSKDTHKPAFDYLVKARAQAPSELSFDPSLDSIVRAVYPYVNTSHDANMGLPFVREDIHTTKVCPTKPWDKLGVGVYSCFNYHTIHLDWANPVPGFFTEPPDGGVRRNVYATSGAGLSDIIDQNNGQDMLLRVYTKPMIRYTASDRAAFATSVISTNDVSSFSSQINVTNQSFSAILSGKFMYGLNYDTTLAEFTPWYSFFCNCMNLRNGLFGNYTNANSNGLRDRTLLTNVQVARRFQTPTLQVSHCTLGTFMSVVSMNATIGRNLSSFGSIVFVNRWGGQTSGAIAAHACLQVHWDQFFKFVRRIPAVHRPDGEDIESVNLGIEHDSAWNRYDVPNHILFVDLSDLRNTNSSIGDMCIPGLQFPNNVHDLFSNAWAPPNDVQRIGVAVGEFFNSDGVDGYAVSLHNSLAMLYGCREAYDSAKYAACLSKCRDAAVFQRFVSNDVVEQGSQWAPDVTNPHRGVGHDTKAKLAKGTALTGIPMLCSTFQTDDLIGRFGYIHLEIPAPDPPMQAAIASRFVTNPNASTIPRLGSSFQSLISSFSSTSAYISWWSDTMHELFQAGWTNYAHRDHIGIVNTINKVTMQAMLCGISWEPVDHLPNGLFSVDDVNEHGATFTQNHLDMMTLLRTPSTLFCSGKALPDLGSVPHRALLVDTVVYNAPQNRLTFGEKGESTLSSLKGRMFLETLFAHDIGYRAIGQNEFRMTPLVHLYPLHYNWAMEQRQVTFTPKVVNTSPDSYQSLLRDFLRLERSTQYLIQANTLPKLLQSQFFLTVPAQALGWRVPTIKNHGGDRERLIQASLDALNL